MVSFGLLPGMILYRLMPETTGYEAYIAFLIPVFSALRLAKFNIDTRQSDAFIGVPTPANALLISSFPFIVSQQSWGFALLQQWTVLAIVAVLMSWLMVAELPLIALKFKSYAWQANKFQYILISVSVILFFAFNFAAIPIIILLYILLSLLHSLSSKTKQT
jgi:CDP-diacylglycerol--serine O-phosphatidyltransferase